jgi:hypothetical protein
MAMTLRLADRVRVAALFALGAFAVHQLRYLASFGASTPAELSHHSHGYMADLLPPLAVFSLAALLATLIRGTEEAAPVRAPVSRRIPLFAAGLLALFVGQECLEGLLAGGQPAGFETVFGHGGWLALPIATLIGAVCALIVRFLERVECVIARAHLPGRRRRLARASHCDVHAAPLLPPISPLAFGLARRPPPVVPA